MASAETDRDTGTVDPHLPESLLAMISEIPWSASLDGSLCWIHAAAKNLYGYSAAELVGNPQLRWDAIHVDDRQRVWSSGTSCRTSVAVGVRVSNHRSQ